MHKRLTALQNTIKKYKIKQYYVTTKKKEKITITKQLKQILNHSEEVSTKFSYDINTYLSSIISEKFKKIVAIAANTIYISDNDNTVQKTKCMLLALSKDISNTNLMILCILQYFNILVKLKQPYLASSILNCILLER
jgi:hypothetical protein